MSAEIGFLVTAALIVTLFGIKLFFGGLATTGLGSEWNDRSESGIEVTARKFVQSFGWEVHPWLVLLAVSLSCLLVFFIFLEVSPDNLAIPAMAAIAVALTWFGLMRDIVQWRARRFETQLIDALDIMISALSVGSNTLLSLSEMALASEGMVKREISDVIKRLDIGLSLSTAMKRMADLYDSEGVRMFVISVQLNSMHGGDLARALSSVSITMRERAKLRMQMTGQLSGVRFAAFMLAAAPYLLYSFFLWAQPQWVSAIHQHNLGRQLLYSAMAIQVAGMIWIFLILNSES